MPGKSHTLSGPGLAGGASGTEASPRHVMAVVGGIYPTIPEPVSRTRGPWKTIDDVEYATLE